MSDEAAASVPARVAALVQRFEHIAATRMQGVPILHPGLHVQAVGFAAQAGGAAVGVLVTPWFMNLLWLPAADDPAPTPVGATRQRRVGNEVFPFIGADEPGFGPFEACSLFSPMAEFADQAAAVDTARAVLAELRRVPEAAAAPPVPSRRALLFGRTAARMSP